MARVILRALLIWLLFCLQVTSSNIGEKPGSIVKPYKRGALQDLVTWDEHSIFVRGQRVLFYSGEFHPFRLPVPSLWLDVFQKIKALGYTGVSFYSDWALLEGRQGNFTAEGIFAFEPFFEAASTAGIYLLARPGPYINAEVSGGGFPGWLQRTEAKLRTPEYLDYTDTYVQSIGAIIAKAQITNGGPVILFQPENEYSQATSDVIFPDRTYFQAVEDQYRAAGIVVPFISNDAAPHGYLAPRTGNGSVDIYGHDAYPLGFDCANPDLWPDGALPTNFRTLHLEQSPSTPYSLVEFQGGSFDPWGGSSFSNCTALLNEQFERVFFKNDFSFGVTIFNIYMTYGGTNWGNLGHPGGYTSYDYGAAIAEDRTVPREKYSEAKLAVNFLKVSPEYLTAVPGNASNGSFASIPSIATTQLKGNVTNFYVVRHAAYNSLNSTEYTLSVPTSAGNITIPQLSSVLALHGRDSKIHVTDYDVGGLNLLYTSAEIFTWKKFFDKTVLVLYGGANETHEAAFAGCSTFNLLEGGAVRSKVQDNALIINWDVDETRRVIKVGCNLFVYILDRNDAYNYWVIDLQVPRQQDNYTIAKSSSIIRAGYLLRTASVRGNTLHLTGDLNQTTLIEVIGGAPQNCSSLIFNDQKVATTTSPHGVITGTLTFNMPNFSLPNLMGLEWKYINSLPEIEPNYSDSAWPNADLMTTRNPRGLDTPTSLYGSDYGFNTGNLLFRGHFNATGRETELYIRTQGGAAYGVSVFLNSTFLGSWVGNGTGFEYNQSLALPILRDGQTTVITVFQDNMGLDENGKVGTDQMKNPRGILNYTLSGRDQSAVEWKITGNLGGEDYRDHARGPLNEGGLWAERQGYHLPNPPSTDWESGKPTDRIEGPGVAFYTTSFNLNLPVGYDIPLSFVFTNSSTNATGVLAYRSQLYVNGYQFGKYGMSPGLVDLDTSIK
ncbi:MAG: hypothetical protein LQ338_004868 [Usnochroma carphineum]|nr:MAG: hypothetical protein LQ338_004868 [Usnochroma carphineum]